MKNIIITSTTALIIGIFLGYVVFPQSSIVKGKMNMRSDMREVQHAASNSTDLGNGQSKMSEMMVDMMAGLKGKTGDAFDEEFILEMVVHHQGAVDMAEEALQNAKHQEIKDLAKGIITTQKAEIAQMEKLYKEWYGVGLPMSK